MLESLHVKNLALIDEVEVTFTDGLNILTGETGAGKSIIIGSINLALGGKADKEYIRTGADYALVELVFSLSEEEEKKIRSMDLAVEDDHTLLLQRKVTAGRSVSKIGGEAVSSSELKLVASILLDMCSQHENQTLLKTSKQVELLDAYAGEDLFHKKEEIRECYQGYQKLLTELTENQLDEKEQRREVDLLSFEVKEIEEAALVLGEDEELEKQYRKMNHAKRIQETVGISYALTGYEEEGAGDCISRALRELKSISNLDEDAEVLVNQLMEIDNLLNDFNRSAADYQDGLSFDEETYIEIQDRLNLLNHLKAKYNTDIDGILLALEEKQKRLLQLSDYEDYLKGLRERLQKEKEKLRKLCLSASDMRRKAAGKLEKQLSSELQGLNFMDVAFEIQITSDESLVSKDGFDQISFLISTNPGEEKKPMSGIASGGELSRIMLAFKSVFASLDGMGTLVFDEIDTGISGKTAWKVSTQLHKLSESHQIICITHLPQIAAQGDSHFLIEKGRKMDRTVTTIKPLSEEESYGELARLLGSDELTEAALQNAKEMKNLAFKSRNEIA